MPVAWPSVSVAKLLLEKPVDKEARPWTDLTLPRLSVQEKYRSCLCFSGLWGGEHMVARQHSWYIWKGIGAGAGLIARREGNRESSRKEATLSD